MFKEETSIVKKEEPGRRKLHGPHIIKVHHMEDGRPVPVQPDGLVDIAIRELDAQIVDVVLIELDDAERPFSDN
jgi:hypothetical protein